MQSNKTYRFIFVTVALGIGLILSFVFSMAGDKSKGPVENMLNGIKDKILIYEDDYILQKREHKRENKLKWFKHIKEDISSIKSSKIVLFGASDNSEKSSFETIINLEDELNTSFPLIHIYNAWGSKSDEQFPEVAVKTIIRLGSTPVITWEPWLSDFDREKYPDMPQTEDPGKNSLQFITNGIFDSYISTWAIEAKKIAEPIFIRFGHEMNDPYRYPWGPHNNKPKDYVAAWIHVHELFDSMGAHNIIWVWSPHLAYGYYNAFYPGDKYVDYIGLGVLNFGTTANWSKWWTFDEIVGPHYNEIDSFGKPIMISEFGCLNVGGDRAKWFKDALESIQKNYPSIKSILFFHYPADKTITNKEVSWYFLKEKETTQAIINQIETWPDSLK